MRAIDILGLAAAVVIALLSLVIEPWSTPWWVALTFAAIVAAAAASRMLSNLPNLLKISAGRPQLFMVIFGTALLAIGGAVGLIGAFQIDATTNKKQSPSKPIINFPYIGTVSQRRTHVPTTLHSSSIAPAALFRTYSLLFRICRSCRPPPSAFFCHLCRRTEGHSLPTGMAARWSWAQANTWSQ